MDILQTPSPNFNSRDGQAVDMLVLHYTGMKSGTSALDRMCEAAAEVSAAASLRDKMATRMTAAQVGQAKQIAAMKIKKFRGGK